MPRRPLGVLVAPLKIEPTWFVTGRPAAIGFVADPDSATRTAQDPLLLYRLTPAEAAVAIAIARGEGLQAVADELGTGPCSDPIFADKVLGGPFG